MLEILKSYKETKSSTLKQKKKLKARVDMLKEEYSLARKEMDSTKISSLQTEINKVEQDIKILNAAISDATYIISWITTGRRPGALRGIERRAVYEREVAFEGKWLDLFIDQSAVIHELPKPDQEEMQMKSDLIEDLKECLTERQIEIFSMLAEGIGQTEIAKMLGVSKQAIHETIARGRRNIKEAGWVLV